MVGQEKSFINKNIDESLVVFNIKSIHNYEDISKYTDNSDIIQQTKNIKIKNIVSYNKINTPNSINCECCIYLENGTYFTESNGQGTQLNPGDIIENTQLIYIYNSHDDLVSCANENVFQVNILGIEVDTPDDKIACETYELPVLTVGEYFTKPNNNFCQFHMKKSETVKKLHLTLDCKCVMVTLMPLTSVRE